MYLARQIIDNQTQYSIRETYRDGEYLKSRHLFSLGTDPSKYIRYPGGKGYYFDEAVEDALRKQGLNPTQDDLDPIFYEFLDPEIKRVIRGFERETKKRLSQLEYNQSDFHMFDMRRVHFLKLGSMNQGQLQQMPPKFYGVLGGKSRDELEQHFIMDESIIRPRELLRYLIAIFDLQSGLERFDYTTTETGTLQEALDSLFIERVCELYNDSTFWRGMPSKKETQVYLRRYMILYFDLAGNWMPSIPNYWRDFINRHRTYRPPRKVVLNMQEASRMFETSWEKLKQMDVKAFTRLYRQQALKLHPDQGGSQEKFIKLTRLYEKLLKKKNRTRRA